MNEIQEEIVKLEKAIDGCFCDDLRASSECARCLTNRLKIAWLHLKRVALLVIG